MPVLPKSAADVVIRAMSRCTGRLGWLLAICVSRVGSYMVYIAYAATLPVLQREWNLSGTAAGSIASAFQIAYAVSLMGCSALADRVGARRVFLAGTTVSAVVALGFAALARDYWSGLGWYTLLALALGGTYTTGILLVAENVPVERRGRAMGMYLAGHSLGLALALVLTGAAIPRGGYVLAFWLLASGPVSGASLAWLAVRSTANVVTPRAGDQRFGGEVLKNRPAMLVIAGYTFHSWELLGMWAWTPAFLAACFVAAGSELTRGAGLGAYMTSLFHVTGMIASLLAGVFADRFGRTPVILVMASRQRRVLARVRLAHRDVAWPSSSRSGCSTDSPRSATLRSTRRRSPRSWRRPTAARRSRCVRCSATARGRWRRCCSARSSTGTASRVPGRGGGRS